MDNRPKLANTLADPTDSSQTATLRPDYAQSGHDLRKQAEELVRQRTSISPHDIKEMSPEKIQQIFHELQVYQIEFQIQNEELRRYQEVLEATRARYFDIYDLAPVGYCTISEPGLIEEANFTAATLLSVARGELIKKPISRFILKEDQDIYYLHRKLLLETGIPQVCDVRMVKIDGSPFWAQLNIAATHNENSASIICFVFTDITEQKLATMTLKENEELFRKLFQRHTTVSLFLDAETGEIIDANDAAVQFYGWPIEVLKQMRIQQINALPPEIVQAEMNKAASSERNCFEFSHRRADGSIRQVEVFSNTIKISRKEFLFSIVHDITERKQEEARVRESEDRFRSLFQDVPAVAVQGYAPDGTIHYWNRASELVYGYSAQEAVGRNLIKLIIPPEMRQEVELAIRQMAETGQPIPPSEMSLMRKDGSRVPIYSSHTVVQVSGQVQELFCIDIDFTQRKQAEESMRRSEACLQVANRELEEQNNELTVLWEKSRLLGNELNAANHELKRQADELEASYKKLNQEKCLLQSVMEALPVGLAITDAKGGTILSNNSFEQIWGDPRPETQSVDDYAAYQAWWAETGDVVKPEEWASARAIQKGETTVGQVMRILRFDGSEAFVINSASPVHEKVGGIVGSVVVIQDISELKRVEFALYESEQRLRLFIEHAPAALAMFDRDMRYLCVSKRWLSDYGLGSRDLCGLSHYEVFPEIPAQWKEIYRRGLAGEILQEDADCLERVDGSVQWVRWEVRPWYSASGDVGGIVIFAEDITKRWQAEDELRARNEDLTIFNNAAVGRELRMIELKKEINDLCIKVGEQPRYDLHVIDEEQ
jgi:PAS domain S-box-containing protein